MPLHCVSPATVASQGSTRPGIDLTGQLNTAIQLAKYAYSEEALRGSKKPPYSHPRRSDLQPDLPNLQLVALAIKPSLVVYAEQHAPGAAPDEVWIAFGGTPITDSTYYCWARDLG